MRADELRDFLVLTDSDSSDARDLYSLDEPVAGFDCVSVPLAYGTIGELEGLQFSTDAVIGGDVLWAGPLSFPSGTVLVTNQSMRPLYRHQLVPGTYHVAVVAPSNASPQSGPGCQPCASGLTRLRPGLPRTGKPCRADV